jgi:hypothetical protein
VKKYKVISSEGQIIGEAAANIKKHDSYVNEYEEVRIELSIIPVDGEIYLQEELPKEELKIAIPDHGTLMTLDRFVQLDFDGSAYYSDGEYMYPNVPVLNKLKANRFNYVVVFGK